MNYWILLLILFKCFCNNGNGCDDTPSCGYNTGSCMSGQCGSNTCGQNTCNSNSCNSNSCNSNSCNSNSYNTGSCISNPCMTKPECGCGDDLIQPRPYLNYQGMGTTCGCEEKS